MASAKYDKIAIHPAPHARGKRSPGNDQVTCKHWLGKLRQSEIETFSVFVRAFEKKQIISTELLTVRPGCQFL